MIDLKKIEERVDFLIENETPEELKEWFAAKEQEDLWYEVLENFKRSSDEMLRNPPPMPFKHAHQDLRKGSHQSEPFSLSLFYYV